MVHPPQVERIDLDYAYPPALELLDPRREEDGGDIYAPEGTAVRFTVTADRPVAASAIVLADGTRVPPRRRRPPVVGRARPCAADGSYRIALVEDDGIETPDDTEYFIRTLLDRPPDVRIVRPGRRPPGDAARGGADRGARRRRLRRAGSFDLVLQKPGDPEVVVPFPGARDGLTGERRAHAVPRGPRGGALATS